MGAIMRLEYGNESVQFKYRTIEGVKAENVVPEFLVLDGQQRLTSMYRATFSRDPVDTITDKKKAIKRFYYLDINKCLDDGADRLEAILSVPADRKIKTDFDRKVTLDLSTRELEYQHEMFPLNIVFDSGEREDWADGYKEYHGYSLEIRSKYKRFRKEIPRYDSRQSQMEICWHLCGRWLFRNEYRTSPSLQSDDEGRNGRQD